MKNKILLKISLIVVFAVFTNLLFAQEEDSQSINFLEQTNFPPLKLIADTNYPIKAISFSQTQEYYAYAISDTIIICNNFTDQVEKVILGHTGQIQQINFFDYTENTFFQNENLETEEKSELINAIISYDNQNKTFIFDVNTKNEKAKLEYNPLISLTNISNYKNLYIASGLSDGNIIITDLQGENDNQQLIKISENSILNIEYDNLGSSLLVTDVKGNIFLISSTTFSPILKVYGFSESCAGAKFDKFSNSFLYQTGKNKLTLRKTDGIPFFDIEVPCEITNFIWNKDKSKIYVATSNRLIWIYSSAGILEGAIFAENPEKIISMDTDFSNKFLLVGFENGSLIKLFIETKFILPDDAIQMQKELDEAEKQKELEELSKLQDENQAQIKKQKILPDLPIEDWRIEIDLGFSTLPEPYTISLYGGIKYLEFELLSPVMFGLGLNYNFGFPQKDFPYKYYHNSREFHPPFLSAFTPYFTVGYNLAPIKNLNFLCTAELKLGVEILQLWSANLAANLTCKPVPSLYVALGLSASIFDWGIFVGGEYNTCLGFGFTTSAFYRFDFKRKDK